MGGSPLPVHDPTQMQNMDEEFRYLASPNFALRNEQDYSGFKNIEPTVPGNIDTHLYTFAVNVPASSHVLLSQNPAEVEDGILTATDSPHSQIFQAHIAPLQPHLGTASALSEYTPTGKAICQREGCGKLFKSKKYLERHIKTCHEPSKMYPCEYCSQTFNRTDSRKRHQDECLKRQAKKGLVNQARKRTVDERPSVELQRPKAFARRTNELTVDTSVAGPILDTLSDGSTPLLSNGSGMTPNSAALDSSSIAALSALARQPVISPRSSSLPYRHSDKRGSRASILPAEYQSPYLQVNGRASPRFSHRHSSSAEASYSSQKAFSQSRSLNQLYAEELALSAADNYSTAADSPGLNSVDNGDFSHPSTPQFFSQDGSELQALRSRLPYLDHSRPSSGEYSNAFGGHQSMSSLDLTLPGSEGISPATYQAGFHSNRASTHSLDQGEQQIFGFAVRGSPVQGTPVLHCKTESMSGASIGASSQRLSQVSSQTRTSNLRHSTNDMCLTEPQETSFNLSSPQNATTSFSLSDHSNFANYSVTLEPPNLNFDSNFTGQSFSDSFPTNFFSSDSNNNNGIYTLDSVPLFGDFVDTSHGFEDPRSPRAPVSAT